MTSCKDLAAARLAAANPSCVGVRLMCNSREREAAQNKNGRATSSGQEQQYGARRCLSPKTKAPRGCARCKASALCSKTGGLFFAATSFTATKNRRTCRPELVSPATSRIASRPAVGILPCHPKNARHSAPLIRLDAGKDRQRVQTPRQNIASFAAPLSCRMLPGHYTTHIVRDPSVIYSGRTGNPETLCWK